LAEAFDAKCLDAVDRLLPVVIGMEACGGAHYWAQRLREHGHLIKLMAPQFFKPYEKSNKHDIADAEAIGEAVTRPTMRFVPIKEVRSRISKPCIGSVSGW
jgi:transposase